MKVLRYVVLFAGALLFLFPFYYMLIGSLQSEPDTSVAGAFPTGGLTLHNYADINSRVDLIGSLINSGIFTGECCSARSSSASSPATPWPGCASAAAAPCSCWSCSCR
ncbi:ABC transporter permease family protein [Paractinoplanes durhamensis]|uniref:hypothetical protein n=1 Tax=Paractinoplanes durhamensis TaxID=113563 RepID=UPI00362FD6AD